MDSTTINTARILAIIGPDSGAWLNALSSPQSGTVLDKNSESIATSMGLGTDIDCNCDAIVDSVSLLYKKYRQT